MFTKKSWLAGLGLLAFWGATAPAASACSVCRCGDSTFNALGTEVFQGNRFQLALDWDRLEKDQAIGEGHHASSVVESQAEGLEAIGAHHEGEEHGEGATSENLVERRLVLTAAWAPSERWQLIARLPFSDRTLREGEEATDSSALADPELMVRWRAWASEFTPSLGRANWVSLLVGVKTDWGKDNAKKNGQLLDQHAQAGTGSTDWLLGISGVHLLGKRSSVYGSLQFRFTGEGNEGYQYGDARLLNFGYEHKVGQRLDLALEMNYRDADADVVDAHGEEDANTGGKIAYVQPRLLFELGKGFVGRLAAQIPAWDDLKGEQEEKTIWNVGLTVTF